MTVDQADIDHVLQLERELQSPAARGNVARLRELLSSEFIEVGASGRRWELSTILDLLEQESGEPDTAEIGIDSLEARPLSKDLVQVFWDSTRDGRRARRTSLWRRAADGWEQIYHQGTPLP
ncbi:DUF4440 domain-containing protein [Mobilicoccus caccae]|uniref:DUF4440 domain-containing protein n=1 Tax=Mobilicoccus caccae TaxID=1859295 RepID=A0ABQ6IYT7_9MICO|nr:DUF4440 domain-containing protein [Mobilicoccus caccae]GMA41872.1 hypothetical protein GCM10025883_39170 [Mobilicoccus caccae]